MDCRRLNCVMIFLLCVGLISDSGNAEKLQPGAIKESKKTEDRENNAAFTSPVMSIERDTNVGNVPIVNPTVPGTMPIVNPTNPTPPATAGPIPTTPASTGGAWCIANPTASQTALQVALDYACGYGGADCSAIQPNAACFDPSTLKDHASYAFNDYYQKNPVSTSCVFGGTAQLSYTDPSHGNCHYALSTRTPTLTPTPPTVTPTPPTPTIPMTPPSFSAPIVPLTPGVGNGYGTDPSGYDYGTEPGSTPSSAKILSDNLGLLITLNCLLFLVPLVNHI